MNKNTKRDKSNDQYPLQLVWSKSICIIRGVHRQKPLPEKNNGFIPNLLKAVAFISKNPMVPLNPTNPPQHIRKSIPQSLLTIEPTTFDIPLLMLKDYMGTSM